MVISAVNIKKIIPVTFSFDASKLDTFIEEAGRRMIAKNIGEALFNKLVDYTGTPADEKLDALIPFYEKPTVLLAFLNAYDTLALKFSDSGIHRVEKEGMTAPYLRQELSVKKQIAESGFAALDDLIRFLEKNASDYPDYTPLEKTHLINSPEEFNVIYDISSSYYIFKKLYGLQIAAEDFHILSILPRELLDDLIAKSNAKSMAANEALLLLSLKKAIAYLTIARGGYDAYLLVTQKSFADTGSEISGAGSGTVHSAVNIEYMKQQLRQIEDTGLGYLKSANAFLKKHATEFPLYLNSDYYTETFSNTYVSKNKKLTML